MFKSKHSGWTWDLKRTPFGGGGSWNPVNIVSDAVSSVSDALASIDPGPAIGSGLASVDKTVNQIPGGWITVGALAAGGAALAYAPEVMALAASEGITPEAAAIATGTAPIDVATGATVPLETLATDVGAAGGAGDVFAGYSATGSAAGTAGETVGSYGAGATGGAGVAGSSGGVGEASGLGTNAPLQGPTYGELGVTGIPEGGAGPTYGEIGYTGLNQGQAISAADNAANLQQAKNALSTANDVRKGVSTANNLAKLLSQGAGSGLSNSLGQLAQGANAQGMALPNLVRGNQSPFAYTAQQPIQNAKPLDLASLANLLKQG